MKLIQPDAVGDFLAYAQLLVASRGDHAAARARAEGAGLARVAQLLETPNLGIRLKDAVTAGSVAGLSAPLSEYRLLASSFLQSSRAALDLIVAAAQPVKLGFSRFAILTVGAGSGGTAEGAAKAVSEVSLDSDDLSIAKAVLFLVCDEELLRLGTQGLFASELRGKLAAEADRVFLSRIVDTSTPTIAASGSNAAAVRADLSAATATLSAGGAPSRVFWIIDPLTASSLALMSDGAGFAFPDMTIQGGSIAGIEVIVSGGIARDTSGPTSLTLVNATQLAAEAGSVIIDASRQASIAMESMPGSPTAVTVFESLWQMNRIGFRAERYFSVAKLRADAVCTIEGAAYGG